MNQEDNNKSKARCMEGTVIRKAGEATAVIRILNTKQHKLYGKKIKNSKNYLVHDPANKAEIGEKVLIKECKPISKKKRWIIAEQT